MMDVYHTSILDQYTIIVIDEVGSPGSETPHLRSVIYNFDDKEKMLKKWQTIIWESHFSAELIHTKTQIAAAKRFKNGNDPYEDQARNSKFL